MHIIRIFFPIYIQIIELIICFLYLKKYYSLLLILQYCLFYLKSNYVDNMNEYYYSQKSNKIKTTFIYEINEDIDDCSICLSNMKYEILKTNCNHFFHKNCLQQWNNTTCPLCRNSLL